MTEERPQPVSMPPGVHATARVFFYGLFMDDALLASKGIRPRATLLPEPKGRSYGVLMEIAENQVAALYSDQSVRDYVAEPVVVHLANDRQVAAVCYNLPAAKLTGTNPQYAAALLALATRLGMPECYLAHIRLATAVSPTALSD